MKVLAAVAALAAVVLVAAGGSGPHLTVSLRQRIAAVTRKTARSLDDSVRAKTASVYGPDSYRAVLKAAGGATTSNRRPGHFYVIVVRGRFTCPWCPRPAGAQSPHGSILTRIWSPDGHGGGFGIRRKLPASLARLGRPTLVSLR
jgi:hypothetical protein